MAESAAQDWEARRRGLPGVGSVPEVPHQQTVTGLARVDNMPWIT